MRQIGFSFLNDFKKEFGGLKLLGHRKEKRPLSTKHPIHLILKSTHSSVFNPSQFAIERLIRSEAKKFNIKLFQAALNWSHVHLLIQIPNRAAYTGFIRSLNSKLVKLLSRILKKDLKGMFELRPFTKILSWGKQFNTVIEYHLLNQQEARGLACRKKKAHTSADLRGNTKKPERVVRVSPRV